MSPDRLLVLIAEDDAAMREVLATRVAEWGYGVSLAESGPEALERIDQDRPELVLMDVVLPGISGLDLLDRLRGRGRERRQVIVITAHGSIDWAVEAMKRGASDFLTKPIDPENLKASLEAAAEEIHLMRAASSLEETLASAGGLGRVIGSSPQMREVFRLIETLAANDASAIITGESGVGKEMVARTIHELSARREGPFVAVNTAAIPEGLVESEVFGHEKGAFTGATSGRPGCFEQADRGTLLLDEIAEMPIGLQPKLLRILEGGRTRRVGGSREIEFDVRVLAATNRTLETLVEEGLLREDLFYRLNVFTLHVPPLRHHREDIPLLAQHFVTQFNEKHGADVTGLREETLDLLGSYGWPGNIRELRNVIERATIVSRRGWIEPTHLPPYLRQAPEEPEEVLVLPVGVTARDAERQLILKTLEYVGYNKAEAARRLQLDVKTIRNKLKAYAEDSPGE